MSQPKCAIVCGDGEFGIKAVGTSKYQDELETIAGDRTEEGADHLCGALLLPEPTNSHDPDAIAVVISGYVVGYIQSNAAPVLGSALKRGGYDVAGCAAKIVGGWDRGGDDRGHFGVRLNGFLPFELKPMRERVTPQAGQILLPAEGRSLAAQRHPQLEYHASADELVALASSARPERRSKIARGLDLAMIVVLLAVGFWWLQRLPRDPTSASTPTSQAPLPIDDATVPTKAGEPIVAKSENRPPERSDPSPSSEPIASVPASAPVPLPKPRPAQASQTKTKQIPPNAPLKLN